MTEHLTNQIKLLRQRALDLQKWIELSKSQYGALILADLSSQLSMIRQAYGRVDLTQPGHDLLIAQLQAREQEKAEMMAFIENVGKEKKFIDTKIKECESRIQQLNSVPKRRSENVIQPDEQESK